MNRRRTNQKVAEKGNSKKATNKKISVVHPVRQPPVTANVPFLPPTPEQKELLKKFNSFTFASLSSNQQQMQFNGHVKTDYPINSLITNERICFNNSINATPSYTSGNNNENLRNQPMLIQNESIGTVRFVDEHRSSNEVIIDKHLTTNRPTGDNIITKKHLQSSEPSISSDTLSNLPLSTQNGNLNSVGHLATNQPAGADGSSKKPDSCDRDSSENLNSLPVYTQNGNLDVIKHHPAVIDSSCQQPQSGETGNNNNLSSLSMITQNENVGVNENITTNLPAGADSSTKKPDSCEPHSGTENLNSLAMSNQNERTEDCEILVAGSTCAPALSDTIPEIVNDVTKENILKKAEKSFSKNKNEYIKKKLDENDSLFYSARFNFLYDNSGSKVVIKIHGPDNLLTVDKGRFVSRIRVLHGSELDFRKSFETNKSKFYDRLIITKILEDKLLDKRNQVYEMFKLVLEDRVKKVTDNRDCAEDILQLSLISSKISIMGNTSILKAIIENTYISDVLRKVSKKFLEAENDLHRRNKFLPKFDHSVSPVINDFLRSLKIISDEAILKHKDHLLKQCPSNNFYLLCRLLNINSLPKKNLLYLSNEDIKIFSDIFAIIKQFHLSEEIVFQNFMNDLWVNFYEKVEKIRKHESLAQLGPLINPIYPFLFKSFLELILQISNITNMSTKNLFHNDGNKFRTAETINWPENSPINNALEQQYRLIFKLLKHFKPGQCSSKKRYNYEYKMEKCGDRSYFQKFLEFMRISGATGSETDIKEERLIWLYILDCGLGNILPKDSNEHFEKLVHSLLKGFANFIKKTHHDRYESFRVAVHNITKFAAQICPYVSVIDNDSVELDHSILDKQIEIVGDILISDDNLVIDHFANLIEVCNEYWKNRESVVGKIVDKSPFDHFKEEIKLGILFKLLEVVNVSFSKKVPMRVVIYYVRLYNEFLEHFKGLEFNWLVSETSLPILGEIAMPFCLKLNKQKSYQVSNAEEFIKILKSNNLETPKHYLIEVIKNLLDTVMLALLKKDWTDSDQLKAAGDLLLTIGHSFTHFKDQADYVDFDNFLTDCTLPFENVINNCETYDEFKSRLNNVENFYLYTRKQSELGVDKALEYSVSKSAVAREEGFLVDINSITLKDSYTKYLEKFTSLVSLSIPDIIVSMDKDLEDVPKIEQWTSEFKQNTIPSLLAHIASIWTILESKDLASIGQRIVPHCVQILCIFRLLGIDKESIGVDKHLAQVLTGQGKSVILGLLSALLAVTGHNVHSVCYSDYLATRDEQAFSEFFEKFSKCEIERRIKYSTISALANRMLTLEINGRKENLRSLVEKLILNDLPDYVIDTDKKESNAVLLIDEVDLFFTERFYPNTYDPCSIVGIPALLEVQPKLWEMVEEGIYDKEILSEKINEFINELIKDAKYEDFKKFLEIATSFFKEQLKEMIAIAVAVSKAKENSNVWFISKYKLEDGFVSFRDANDIYRTNVYDSYHNAFNYFRLKESGFDHKKYSNYGYIHVSCGHISYANLPKEYSVILGVSGTLTTLTKSEKVAIKSYGINTMTVMPSFFGDCKLKFKPNLDFCIIDSEEGWLQKIYEHIMKKIVDGRAVIVFFDTETEIKEFNEKFCGRINRLHILTGNEDKSLLLEYINEAGVSGTVTLSNRGNGRGVDFKSNDLNVEKAGGTHVIQTVFSSDVKEETQFMGRTARKTNEGSYELIVCRKHLEKLGYAKTSDGSPVTNYRHLCEIRKKKTDIEGINVNEKIKKSEEKHNMTMEFSKSFYDYTPDKREAYFSSYPFVKPKEENN